MRAWTTSRRLPNSRAAPSPAATSPGWATINSPSRKESVALSTHTAAGAANGRRRRSRSVRTRAATATTSSHNNTPVGCSGSCRNAVPTALSAAAIKINMSRPYFDQNSQRRLIRPRYGGAMESASSLRRMPLLSWS